METTMVLSQKALTLRGEMRVLWAEHVLWTRHVIISTVANLPDVTPALNRLLKNQDDIGSALVPYYGSDAGNQVSELLREHIMQAVELVKATIEGDQSLMNDLDSLWHVNADKIASFLSLANSFWPEQDTRDMLYKHLSLTKDEAAARIQGAWEKDIALFDQIADQAVMMGDNFCDGIIKQFPQAF